MNARVAAALLVLLPVAFLLALVAKIAIPTANPGASAAAAATSTPSEPIAIQPVRWSGPISDGPARGDRPGPPQVESDPYLLSSGRGSNSSQAAHRSVTVDEIAGLTGTAAGDLDAFWERAFLAEGRYYSRASYVLVQGMTPTACAWDGATSPGAGSFYCPWDQTIYLDVPALQLEASRYGEVAIVFTLAHEWSHHAQFQRGDLQERSRAVELRADCLAGAYLADAVVRGRVPSRLVEHDLPQIVATLGDVSGIDPTDAEAHGSGEQRLAMLVLGYVDGITGCGD